MIRLKPLIENDIVPRLKPTIKEKVSVREVPRTKGKQLLKEELLKRLEIDGRYFEIIADDGDEVLFDVFCVQKVGAGGASKAV